MPRDSTSTFGDVRIRATVETEAAGSAGRPGQATGFTDIGFPDVGVIGEPEDGVALYVSFRDRDESAWFAYDLVEFLDAPSAEPAAPKWLRWLRDRFRWRFA